MVRVPGYQHPTAGGWPHSPRTRTRLPASRPLADFTRRVRTRITQAEGTRAQVVPASGLVTLIVGPDGLRTWYLTHATVQTTTGANDTSTVRIQVGPASGGIVLGGQAYAGGGESVGLGNQPLRPGDFVTAQWTGAKPGDTAQLTVFGDQDVLL